MLLIAGQLGLGFALLIIGGELLVRGSSRIASVLGVPHLIIGLTVVAMGTSAPEAVVSVVAVRSGAQDIALGNVVGSNVFNVLFILGLSALITPLAVSRQLVKYDVPILIVASFILLYMAGNGTVSRGEGALLCAGLGGYIVLCYFLAKRDPGEDETRGPEEGPSGKSKGLVVAGSVLAVTAGLVALVLGSRWLVDGASALARMMGMSELIIGLTIVAAGTSLPEAATSIIAAIRGERDIAVGNVVGSCIFNVLGVAGVAALAGAQGITAAPDAVQFDLPVMAAISVVCLPIFFTGFYISRWEGGLLFAYYLLYTAFLILRALDHQAAETFSWALGVFIVPLTFLTLFVIAGGHILKRRRQKDPE